MMHFKEKLFRWRGLVLVSAFLSVWLCSACERETATEKEYRLLQEYLIEHSIDVQPTYSGLYYIELREGIGADAKGGDVVRVKYKGTFLDGSVFDSGTFTFTIGYGEVIRGWDEGINYMKEGGKALLIVPSALAYGAAGRGNIPGYSTLIFEVELLNIII